MTTSNTGVPRFVYNGKRKTFNPDFVALWESYFDEGMSRKHVAEVFSVDQSSVEKYYPGRGWTPQQAREHGVFVRQINRKMKTVTYV